MPPVSVPKKKEERGRKATRLVSLSLFLFWGLHIKRVGRHKLLRACLLLPGRERKLVSISREENFRLLLRMGGKKDIFRRGNANRRERGSKGDSNRRGERRGEGRGTANQDPPPTDRPTDGFRSGE